MEHSSLTSDNQFYTFSNLGIWRKIYLILNWLVVILYGAIFILTGTEAMAGDEIDPLVLMVIMFIMFAYTLWLHKATSGRKLVQLRWIAGLTLIPLMNPIAALIILLISITTKRELNKAINDSEKGVDSSNTIEP